MTYTKVDAMLALANILTNVVGSNATGGTTTTLVDTKFPWLDSGGVVPPDDYYNGGTIFFTSGDNEGGVYTITDWVNATKTFTIGTTLTDTIAAIDYYSVCNNEYPKYILNRAIIVTLDSMKGLPTEYSDATYITVADQINYDLPTNVYNVVKVEIARDTSAPYYYVEHKHWREIGDDIYFDENSQPNTAGYRIRLTYIKPFAGTGTISDYVHINRLKWEAAVFAIRWKLQKTGGDDPLLASLLTEAMANAERMRHKYPLPRMNKQPHLAFWVRSTPNQYDN